MTHPQDPPSGPLELDPGAVPETDAITQAIDHLPVGPALTAGSVLLVFGAWGLYQVVRAIPVRSRLPSKGDHAWTNQEPLENAASGSLPDRARRPFLGFELAVAIFFLTVLGQFGCTAALRWYLGREHWLVAHSLYLGLVSRLAGSFVAVVYLAALMKVRARTWTADFGWPARVRDGCVDLGRGLLAYLPVVPLFLGAVLLERGLQHLLGVTPDSQEAIELLNSDPALRTNPWVLLGLGVAIPCFEELLFRGLLLPAQLAWMPAVHAIWINAALFSWMHDAGYLPVFALGLTMAILYHRTGRLLTSIALHVTHNSVVLGLLVVLGGS